MELGFGVFLGSVFLRTVLLYLKTLERWNWRTIAKRFGIAVAGLLALGVVVFGGARDSAHKPHTFRHA